MEADPFFWSIDEVVAYLCHGSFDDWARSSLPRPDPVQLESHLRENYVTGEVLLTEVDREALPRYLGLKALGHQATIFKAIQYLRSRSSEFHNYTNGLPNTQNAIAAFPARIDFFSGPPANQNRSVQTPARSSHTPQVPPTRSDAPQPVESTPKGPDLSPPQQKESDGRKRRRLNPSAISTQTLHNIPENPRQKKYLCSQKQPVKDVFYKGIESDEDNDLFGYVRPSNSSTGQSLFVNKRMQYFLQQVPQPFPDGKGSLAVFPYDNTVAPDVPRYFTLYEKNDRRINVRMEEVGKWPHLKEKSALDYLAIKYPPCSEELPLYGESGSEDYDSDTCRDMDEARDDAENENKDNTSNLMSAAELNEIIEKFVADTIEKWRSNKLPVHERKAWSLWERSRRAGTVPSDIRRAKAEIAHLDGRLANWSKGIKSNEYEKDDRGKVLQQCASLEVTITQRELQKWQLSVLELGVCPPKPSSPPICRKVIRPRLKSNDEESIGSDTDDANEDNSDFVVPDDAHKDTKEGICPPDNTILTPHPSSMSSRKSASPQPGLAGSSPMNGPFEDVELVDLTQADQEDQQEAAENDVGHSENLEIHTPPLNPADSPKDRLQFPSSSLLASPVRNETPSEASPKLPDFADVVAMDDVDWITLERRRDRKRLLAKTVYTLSEEERAMLFSLISSIEKNAWRRLVKEALKAIQKSKKNKLPSATEEDSFYYRRMATLYVSWYQVKRIHSSKGIPKVFVKEAREKDCLYSFYNDLTEILRVEHPKKQKREASCEIVIPLHNIPRKDSTQANNPIIIEDEEDEPFGRDGEAQGVVRATPRKKRKRAVAESREAMESQNRAQRRVEEQATQQRRLQEEGGIENDDPERKIVSFDDPIIYLHRDLGRRVKEHQISGIQFMWRELIKDEKNEGCLLAHTMGLGKTMQVISLLVTIANASNSSDPKIKSQVPERLRTSRTLITCPASLIDNWDEEFAKWTPLDAKTRYNLGEVRKVVSPHPIQRFVTINAWYTEGGVLLISHELLRRMIHDPTQKAGSQKLPVEKSEIIKRQLLDGPNIIVADEAHKLKNGASNLSKACSMFTSKSRIALTGSPLSNQLIDYYQMINWISPGYLGTLKQFKAKYEEPIKEGLYYDSTNWEYVRSRKKLEVLKKVLEPKVNRAGISVIQKDLPSKVEFVIVIPVTRLQEETYNQFVSLTMEGKGDFEFTRLWALLSYLTLLCHHPFCFLQKLLEKKKKKNEAIEREKVIEGSQIAVVPSESEPEVSPEDSPTLAEVVDAAIETEEQTTITDELVSQFEQKFKNIENLGSPEHSRRTQMVGQIVDESIKAGDKVLIFSGYLHTLTYIGKMLAAKGQKFCRLDGKTPIATRQAATKNFSESDSQVYLISTKAGALGLNIIGANRVIIFESEYNPTWEEQAIGRAYRLGQTKEVFVYRFVMGGTFEELIHEKGIFKKNMALRAVDKKNPTRSTGKSTSEFRRPIRNVKRHDLAEFHGKDPKVLDKILAQPNDICKIILTETLHREDAVQFTAEERNEIQAELDDERLERSDPVLWAKKQHEKRLAQEESARRALAQSRQQYPLPFPPNMVGNVQQFQPSLPASPLQWRPPYVYNGNGAVNPQSVPAPRTPVPRPSQPPTPSHVSDKAQPLSLAPTPFQGQARTTQAPSSQPAPIQAPSPAQVQPISVQTQPSIAPSYVPTAPPPSTGQQNTEPRSAQPPPLPPSTAQPLQNPKANGSKQVDKGMRDRSSSPEDPTKSSCRQQ